VRSAFSSRSAGPGCTASAIPPPAPPTGTSFDGASHRIVVHAAVATTTLSNSNQRRLRGVVEREELCRKDTADFISEWM
jgi:hypothetical protein